MTDGLPEATAHESLARNLKCHVNIWGEGELKYSDQFFFLHDFIRYFLFFIFSSTSRAPVIHRCACPSIHMSPTLLTLPPEGVPVFGLDFVFYFPSCSQILFVYRPFWWSVFIGFVKCLVILSFIFRNSLVLFQVCSVLFHCFILFYFLIPWRLPSCCLVLEQWEAWER